MLIANYNLKNICFTQNQSPSRNAQSQNASGVKSPSPQAFLVRFMSYIFFSALIF